MKTHCWILSLILLSSSVAWADGSSGRFDSGVPAGIEDFTAATVEELAGSAESAERWAASAAWRDWSEAPQEGLQMLERVITAKRQVDRQLDEVTAMRTRFVQLSSNSGRQEKVRRYLQVMTELIDLSGRLRYTLRDAIDNLAFAVEPHPTHFDRLLDLLHEQRISIGAPVMSYVLFDPPPESEARPFPLEIKTKVLRLSAESPQTEVMPALADLVREQRTSTRLLILAAETIRKIGLPQDERPGQDDGLPKPVITASELWEILKQREPDPAHGMSDRRAELLDWLEQRQRRGVVGDSFRLNGFDLRPGDWLLMRNPSPYNMFTDLAPGLFTHVGVVAVEQGSDGRRRFVIVELPERGDRIPATNVDLYVQRTVHYFFVRHRDRQVGQKMGEVAASLIGKPSQFDLNFRTDRVPPLRGRLDEQSRIHTYCAGFLLICAQETAAPREEFFPLEELPAGGHYSENLAKLGLSIGEDFISPTGAVFSPQLEIVGRRQPMYSPGREIQESVYDHFAHCMIEKQLTPAPDIFQALREKLAGLSQYNPWLAKAMAEANNVSEHLDLKSAAKAAAVVETLDEIANTNRDEFFSARQALLAGPLEALRAEGADAETIARVEKYRRRHQELFTRLSDRRLSPRQLRVALVDYYSDRGRQQIERRFFPESP